MGAVTKKKIAKKPGAKAKLSEIDDIFASAEKHKQKNKDEKVEDAHGEDAKDAGTSRSLVRLMLRCFFLFSFSGNGNGNTWHTSI